MTVALPIRTNQFDITLRFFYSLINGEIWIKPQDPTLLKTMRGGEIVDTTTSDWQKFDVIGIPYHGDYKSLLGKDEVIVEFSVASEVLFAVSNLGIGYIYKPTDHKRPTVWNKFIGQPIPHTLTLPEDRRSMSLSTSVGLSLNKKLSFMDPREIVVHTKDGAMISREIGITITVYVLTANGWIILFWDTGLESFTHGIVCPFQADIMSAAGSTIFISGVDEGGNLYFATISAADFEGFKLPPGFIGSFVAPEPNPHFRNGYVPLGQGVRKFPMPDWLMQDTSMVVDPIDLSKYDPLDNKLLTSKISIHLVGQGDAARQLRIVGYKVIPSALGNINQIGIYYRFIYEKAWNFVAIPMPITVPRFIHPYNPAIPTVLKNYSGAFLNLDNPYLHIELRDFHPYNITARPATLILRLGSEYAYILVYTIEGWGVFFHKKDHDKIIGTKDGEDHSLRVTLKILFTESNLLANDSPLGEIICKDFLPLHMQTNALIMVANNEEIKLKSIKPKNILKMFFTRKLSPQELNDSYYIRQVRDPVLQLHGICQDRTIILEKLNANKAVKEKIKKDHRRIHLEALLFFFVNIIASVLRKIARPASHIYFLITAFKKRKIPEKAMGHEALKSLKTLFPLHSAILYNAARSSHESSYKIAKNELKIQITKLENDYKRLTLSI